jgi:hypothetical protein
MSLSFIVTILTLNLLSNGDPAPITVPPRPGGMYGPPSLVEPPIAVTVSGLSGYNAELMSRKRSVFSP